MIGAESFEETEQRIRAANPPAYPIPPTEVPTLAVSANCRSLKIGSTRYAFAFRRMGCRKATNLATMAHLSGAAQTATRARPGKARGSAVGDGGIPRSTSNGTCPRAPSDDPAERLPSHS